jgi:predicted amidohydrolase
MRLRHCVSTSEPLLYKKQGANFRSPDTRGRLSMPPFSTMGSPKRTITVAAAQLGAVKSLDTPRSEALTRMIQLLEQASEAGVRLVVFPELAFTTFFPSHIIQDEIKLVQFLEPTTQSEPYAVLNSENVRPLVNKANETGIDISFGFGERFTAEDGTLTNYNSALYYSAVQRRGVAKYRKVHLPGRVDIDTRPNVIQQLEKRYFTPGDLGFQAFRVPGLIDGALKSGDVANDTEGKGDPIIGMLICNDRRWAEAWRSYGLQGVEILIVSHRLSLYRPIILSLIVAIHRRAIIQQHMPLNTTGQSQSRRRRPFSTIICRAKAEATLMPAIASM